MRFFALVFILFSSSFLSLAKTFVFYRRHLQPFYLCYVSATPAHLLYCYIIALLRKKFLLFFTQSLLFFVRSNFVQNSAFPDFIERNIHILHISERFTESFLYIFTSSKIFSVCKIVFFGTTPILAGQIFLTGYSSAHLGCPQGITPLALGVFESTAPPTSS